MSDDSAVFLTGTRQESRNVFDRQERDVERIASSDESCSLVGSVDVQASCSEVRLVGDNAYCSSVQSDEACNDVLRIKRHNIEVFAFVCDLGDHIVDVVSLVRVVRNDLVEFRDHSVYVVVSSIYRSRFHVVGRHVAQQFSYHQQSFLVVLAHEVSNTAYCIVSCCAAQLFCSYFFTCYSLDNSRSCDEHLACLIYHEYEVRDSRRIYRAACARSHDHRDLRNHAGRNRVVVEDLAESGKSRNTFFYSGTAGILQSNDRCTHFQSHVLHFDDFFCVIFTQGSTAYSKVLRKCEYQSSVYLAIACYNAVTQQFFFVHAEVRASVFYEHIDFNKAVFIKKNVQSFSRSQLASGMLCFDSFFASALCDFLFFRAEIFKLVHLCFLP